MTSVSQPLEAALQLASEGIPSFACRADKAPLTRRGLHDATVEASTLRAMFAHPAAQLVGVPTGPSPASNIDVLDIDAPGLGWLAENRNRTPVTREHDTRSGGVHVLFQAYPGLRNSASKIAKGVDTRCSGGYCIWWSSIGLPVRNSDTFAPWPEWLLDLLLPKPLERAVPIIQLTGDRGERYARAALKRAVECIATARPGCRNDLLNREAFALGRFVPDTLDAAEVADALAVAGRVAGLNADEVARTLASALRARRPA